MDHVGSSLLELRYANEVIRQHLHEWLRFSRHLEECGLPLPTTGTDTVRQYVARRTAKTSASRSRVLRASVRIFLETDERGKFRRRVWLSFSYASLVCPDSDAVFAVCANASRTGGENGQEVHPKVVGVRPVPGGRRRHRTRPDYARARS